MENLTMINSSISKVRRKLHVLTSENINDEISSISDSDYDDDTSSSSGSKKSNNTANSTVNTSDQSILPSISYLQKKYINATDQFKSIILSNKNPKSDEYKCKIPKLIYRQQKLHQNKDSKDSQEKFLAKIKLLLNNANNKLESLIIQHNITLNENDELNDQIRLITYELINAKSDILKLKEVIRNENRNKILIENDMFTNECTLSTLLRYIDQLNNKILHLNHTNDNKDVLVEQWRMYSEDLYRKYQMKLDYIDSLTNINKTLSEELQSRKKYNHRDISVLKFNLIRMTAQKNSLENKVKSISKDLEKQLYRQIPLSREIFRLKQTLQQVTMERDFYKEKIMKQYHDSLIPIVSPDDSNTDCNLWYCESDNTII